MSTNSKFGIFSGLRTLIVVAVVVGGLAACGSDDDASTGDGGRSGDATTDLSTDTSAPDSTGASSVPASRQIEEPEEYGWSIPDDDVSPAFVERDVYNGLRKGCAAGQAALDGKWYELGFPGNVLLFQAAVHACEGRRNEAQAMFDRAAEHLGHPAGSGDCEVYMSLVSYLDQVPRYEVKCLDGDPTDWPSGDRSFCRDDPRTAADESLNSGSQGDCQLAETPTTEEESTTQPGPSTEEQPTTTSISTTSVP